MSLKIYYHTDLTNLKSSTEYYQANIFRNYSLWIIPHNLLVRLSNSCSFCTKYRLLNIFLAPEINVESPGGAYLIKENELILLWQVNLPTIILLDDLPNCPIIVSDNASCTSVWPFIYIHCSWTRPFTRIIINVKITNKFHQKWNCFSTDVSKQRRILSKWNADYS